MINNNEIEFKCPVTKKQYEELLKKFELEYNVYSQTNYYFDSENQDLLKEKTTLRIRHKMPNSYKLTMKSCAPQGYLEQSVFLSAEEAQELIENGFNLQPFFERNLDVKFYGKLNNDRVSTPYRDGELFLDKIEYFGIEDYEIEYEVDNYEIGEKDFEKLLKENNITLKKSKRKSQRVFEHVSGQ